MLWGYATPIFLIITNNRAIITNKATKTPKNPKSIQFTPSF